MISGPSGSGGKADTQVLGACALSGVRVQIPPSALEDNVDEHDQDYCARCGAKEGGDLRTLWMACLYEMNELGLPFEEKVLFHAELKDCTPSKPPTSITLSDGQKINLEAGLVKCSGELAPHHFFTLRVCKNCRGEWMEAITRWFKIFSGEANETATIPVRVHGRTVWMTPDEYRQHREV